MELVERLTSNQTVTGSIPFRDSDVFFRAGREHFFLDRFSTFSGVDRRVNRDAFLGNIIQLVFDY